MNLSVVIASYNHAPYLRACIESALGQTLAPAEVIVVDDGSTDGSRAIIESFGAAVHPVFQKNSGTCAALNAGIALASCEWIALHNSDDLWEPEKLERQAEIAMAHPEAGLIHTGVRYIDAESQPFDSPPGANLSRYHGAPCANLLPLMLHTMPVVISSAMVAKRAWERVSGFDVRYLGLGDWDFCLRVSKTFPFGFVGAPLTRVRKHAASAGMDSARLPSDWQERDWRYLSRETMPAAARALFEQARRGDIGHQEAALALASLATLLNWEADSAFARSVYALAVRLQPLRWKTSLRYMTTFLPHSMRKRLR